MSSRPTRIWERTFVDQDHVFPSQLGQMTNDAIADDAGANNDDLGAMWKFAHVETPELSTTVPARDVAWIGVGSISVQYH